jgi:hypothetical protein
MKDLGWGGDHVGKLHRLQIAVSHLAQGKGKTSQRLEKATYALIGLFPKDFPKYLQNRAENVLGLRLKYVFHAGDDSYFNPVPPSERKRFTEDLLALYEACLIDIGRAGPDWDFMYPEDRQPPKKKTKA